MANMFAVCSVFALAKSSQFSLEANKLCLTFGVIMLVIRSQFVSRVLERNKDAKEFLYLPDDPQENKFC